MPMTKRAPQLQPGTGTTSCVHDHLSTVGDPRQPLSSLISADTCRSRTKLGIREWLLALALAAILPVLLFAGLTANRLAVNEQQARLTELEHRTEAAANTIERYLQSQRELAITLAAAAMLPSGDLAAFYDFAKRAMEAGKIGRSVALVDPAGKMLLNTRRPFGADLPAAGDVQGVAETLARKAPHIANLFKGAVSATHVFTVWAPVFRDGQLISLVGVTLEPRDLIAALREERLPAGWVSVVLDRQGTIVARTLAPEAVVGQSAAPATSQARMQGTRGAYSFTTREGVPASAYYIKLPENEWTVAVSAPRALLDEPARRSLQFMLGLGLATLAAAGVLSFMVGRLMSGPTSSVARAAIAVGEGRAPEIGRSNVRELDEVSRALVAAHGLILAREAALRESETRLRSILESANVIAWEVELDGDRIHCVGPAARLFDKPCDYRMDSRKAFLEGVAAEDRKRVIAQFRSAAQAEAPYSCEFRVPLSGGGFRWICSEGVVEHDKSDQPARMRGISYDISKRKASELALADAMRMTAVACEAGHMGTWHRDIATNRLSYSDELLALIGIDRDRWGGTPDALEAIMHPDDIDSRRRMRAMAESIGKAIDIDFRILRPDGEVRWMSSRGRMVLDAEGHPVESFGVMVDVTDRKRAEEHAQALAAELDHRVKNVLARVQVVARRTREGSNSLDEFVTALNGRIDAMAKTHSQLSLNRWTGVGLSALVRGELAAYAAHGNTTVEGPEVVLEPDSAQAVTTVLHELATNAAKYGALSTGTGRVGVCWRTITDGVPEPALVIEWKESGGPNVIAPERSGYGTSVIRNQIPYELQGTVDLTYPVDGVHCRIEIPLSRLTAREEEGSAALDLKPSATSSPRP